MIGILTNFSITHIGIAKGLKNAREEIANVNIADMTYIALAYRLDNPIFPNIVILIQVVDKANNLSSESISCLDFYHKNVMMRFEAVLNRTLEVSHPMRKFPVNA